MSLPVFRHLDYGSGATVRDLGAAGVAALLDGGDVGDWAPLLTELGDDPWGPVASRVEQVLDHLETRGTGHALRSRLERCRARASSASAQPRRGPTS